MKGLERISILNQEIVKLRDEIEECEKVKERCQQKLCEEYEEIERLLNALYDFTKAVVERRKERK
jgi:hypothetical protein